MASPILVWAHLDSRAKELLQTTPAPGRVHYATRQAPTAEDLALLGSADLVFGNVPRDLLPRAPRLRWMQLESIGFEYYQATNVANPGLQITNLKGMFEWPAAETALAGLLALTRGLNQLILAQRDERWTELKVRPQTRILHRQSALILGAGSIGRRMRALLQAFECEIHMFARNHPDADVRTPAELADRFSRSDIVVCCLPKTPATIGLVSRALIESMPSTAFFVNIGRGAVVDEPALIEALESKRIGGAVIDVTVAEPIPPGHRLWRCPNTLLTQHTGGGYADELVDKARAFLDNLGRYRRGEALRNLIDLNKGY